MHRYRACGLVQLAVIILSWLSTLRIYSFIYLKNNKKRMLSCKCSETALFMKVAYISCSDRTTLIRTISGCFCKEQNPDHFRLQRYWIFKSGLQSVRRNRRQITHFHFQVPGQLKCFNLDSLGGWWDHQWEFSDTFIKCWNEKKKKEEKFSAERHISVFMK